MPFNTVSVGIHATMHNINGQFALGNYHEFHKD